MQASVKISIGLNEETEIAPESYTQVKFDVELHKDKIEEKLLRLRQQTGKFRVPSIIIDFPQSAKNLKLDYMKPSHDIEFSEVDKDGRCLKLFDMKEKDLNLFKKKMQKIFGKMNQLDNKLFLHLDLYNVQSYHEKLKQKQDYPMAVFLEKAKFQANLSTDPKFFQLLAELTGKISPKFAESPLMAVLPLFGSLNCEIEMDSLKEMEEDHQKQLFDMKSYEEPDDDEEGKAILQAFDNKDKVYLHLSFENLGILTIDLEVRMFAYYHCLI